MVDDEMNETENRNPSEDEPGQSEAFKARVAQLESLIARNAEDVLDAIFLQFC